MRGDIFTKKILNILKYVVLSAVLFVFAVIRFPFGTAERNTSKHDGEKDNSLFPKAYADIPGPSDNNQGSDDSGGD